MSAAASGPTGGGGAAGRWRQRLRELGPAAPWFVVATVGPLLGVLGLAASTATWRPWFDGSAGSAVAYWFAGAIAAAGCLLPTHATSLLAGVLFGSALGGVLAWLVILTAAALGYGLWTPLVGERALRALADSPRGRAVHRALLGSGTWRAIWVIALLRLSPVLPFAATNLLLAAFGVRGLPFLAATVLGVTPRALAVAYVGAELGEVDWRQGQAPAWTTWLAIAATLLAVVAIGRVARRALRHATAEPDGA